MSWRDRATPVNDWRSRAKPVQAQDPRIIDEAAPEVSFLDRTIAKNLAQSPQKMAEYIKKEYPHLDVKVAGSDVLIGRNNEYRKLDPSSLELADVTDIADVVGAGVASTLGTIGGGTVGALAGGAGAVPGALAGSAAAGSAYEALRQRLGKALGIPQEVSGTDVAIEGVGNALGGAILGTGLKEGAKGAYKGLIREGWNKATPAFARYWTGVTDDVLKLYTNPVTREQIDQLSEGGRIDLTKDIARKIRSGLAQERTKVGQKIGEATKNAEDLVNLSGAKQTMRKQIDFLEGLPYRTGEEDEALDAAKAAYVRAFGRPDAEIPDMVRADAATRYQNTLADIADLKSAKGVGTRYAADATAQEKALADAAGGAYDNIKTEIDRVTENLTPELRDEYRKLMQDQANIVQGIGRTDQSAYSAFTNLDQKSKVALKESLEKLSKRTGEDYKTPMNMLQAANYFGSNSWIPQSIGGTTGTARAVPASIMGGVIGGQVGAAYGEPGYGTAVGIGLGGALASPQALKYVIKNSDGVRSLANQLGQIMDQKYVTPIVRETLVQSPWLEMD